MGIAVDVWVCVFGHNRNVLSPLCWAYSIAITFALHLFLKRQTIIAALGKDHYYPWRSVDDSISLFQSHVLDEIHHTAAVAILIVVPCYKLDELFIECNASSSIEDLNHTIGQVTRIQ